VRFEDLKKNWNTKYTKYLIPLLHSRRTIRRGSKRSKIDIIRLAELSYEVIRDLEQAGTIRFMYDERNRITAIKFVVD